MISEPKQLITRPKRDDRSGSAVGCCAYGRRRALALSIFRGQVDAGTSDEHAQLKEVLRLKWSHRQIRRVIGVSVGTISAYAARASEAGLDWAAAEPLTDDELEISREICSYRLLWALDLPVPPFHDGTKRWSLLFSSDLTTTNVFDSSFLSPFPPTIREKHIRFTTSSVEPELDFVRKPLG